MAYTLKMEYQVFFLHFPKELSYGYLRFEGKWKIPISFKPKVSIAEFFWKMQRKTWYSILGFDAMPLSLRNLLLNGLATVPWTAYMINGLAGLATAN